MNHNQKKTLCFVGTAFVIGMIAFFTRPSSPGVEPDEELGTKLFAKFDGQIRRRLRMCLLRQLLARRLPAYWWKLPRTKARKLRGLGLDADSAFNLAYSGKGPWRLSRTAELHRVLDNAFWRKQGYTELASRYLIIRQGW